MYSKIQLLGRQWKSQYLAIMFPFGWLLTQGDKPRSTLLSKLWRCSRRDVLHVCVCVHLRVKLFECSLLSPPLFFPSFRLTLPLSFLPVCSVFAPRDHVCAPVWTCVSSVCVFVCVWALFSQLLLCVWLMKHLRSSLWFTGLYGRLGNVVVWRTDRAEGWVFLKGQM